MSKSLQKLSFWPFINAHQRCRYRHSPFARIYYFHTAGSGRSRKGFEGVDISERHKGSGSSNHVGCCAPSQKTKIQESRGAKPSTLSACQEAQAAVRGLPLDSWILVFRYVDCPSCSQLDHGLQIYTKTRRITLLHKFCILKPVDVES